MKTLKTTVSIIALIMTVMIISYPASAGDLESLSVEGFKKVAQGGLLYDKWHSVLEVTTEGTHPSYPAEGKNSGESSWRCKECHGWDYRGKDGA